MRISINNSWLTNDGASDLKAWSDAHEVRLNGRQVVQDAQFLRAVSAEPMARGNAVNELQFSVTQQHASVAAAAAAFALTAFSMLPAGGTAAVVCGAYSNHNFGIAFDVGIFNGGVYLDDSPLYAKVGALGRSQGLEWGGDWTSFPDEPHFQMPFSGSLSEARALVAIGTWAERWAVSARPTS